MENKPSPYYVPQQSGWPVLGAIAILVLALGSLNLGQKWGVIALIMGLLGLIFMLAGWLKAVIKESDAGLYNQQMDKTFRWGMFWFLISELFLFGLLLGSIFHVRFSITPWLAGESGDASVLTHYLLWPDFSKHWPLITTPANSPAASNIHTLGSMRSIPFMNMTLLLISGFISLIALISLRKGKYKKSFRQLSTCILLGILFLALQTYYFFYLIKCDIIVKTGVYGSFLISFLGLHTLNIIAVLIFLTNIVLRIYQKRINTKNTFALDAGVGWWCFLAGICLIGFITVF